MFQVVLQRFRILGQFPQFSGHYRYMRSVARREQNRPKLLKGNVVTLDNDMGDAFGDVEDYGSLNRALKKMFLDPEEVQNEAEMIMEGDHETVVEKAGQYCQMHETEERDYKRYIRRQITKRKYFKEKETNLLTYVAKRQIRFLHNLDPKEWTPQKISECFPISEAGVKKLVNSTYEPRTEDKIKRHDAEVAERWKSLENNENLASISPFTLQLWREGKLVQNYYSGNVSLPQAPEPKCDIEVKPKKVGEHLAIIKKYLDIKKTSLGTPKQGNTMESAQSSIVAEQKKIMNKVMPDFSLKYPSRSEVEDPKTASYLATKTVTKSDPDVTAQQFEDNLIEEYSTNPNKTSTDSAYLNWLQKQELGDTLSLVEAQPQDSNKSEDVYLENVKKYEYDSIELIKANAKDARSVPYLYSSEKGYQFPLGKNIIPGNIKIPPNLIKKGATYKVGQCYYDHTGEFLYKLPIQVK